MPRPTLVLALVLVAAPVALAAVPLLAPGAAPSLGIVHGRDGRALDASAWPGDAPVFEEHLIPAGAWEPTVAAMEGGHVALIGMTSVRTDVWTSADSGRTWSRALQQAVPTALDGTGLIGDPYLYLDPATGRLFTANLYSGDGCTLIQWSDDRGVTWEWSVIGACLGDAIAHDHQSIVAARPRATQTVGYPNLLHYCASDFYVTAWCGVSADGGLTWSARVDSGLHRCSGATGHLAAAPDGTVFLPQLECGGDEAWVSISRDGGATWTPVLVERTRVHADHDSEVAVDAAGNAYYLFFDDRELPRLSISRDGGATWAPSFGVAFPGLTGCKHPSIVAGDVGRIAFLCIGTTVPGGWDMTDADAPSAAWNAYVTMSLDALAKDPVFLTTTAHASNDPVARGKPVELYYLGDFLKIAMAPDTGAVHVAMVDACTVLCTTSNTPRQAVWYPGAVGVQVAGSTLRETASP